MEYLEKLKFIAYTILAWVLAVVSNIKDVIIVLGIIFIINIVAGVSTALNKKKETFSIWKFFEAFELLMFYLYRLPVSLGLKSPSDKSFEMLFL